jgi:hypothetical protein
VNAKQDLRKKRALIFKRGRSDYLHLDYWHPTQNRRIQVCLGTTDLNEARRMLEENKLNPILPRQKIKFKPEHLELVKDVAGDKQAKHDHLCYLRATHTLLNAPNPERFDWMTKERPSPRVLGQLGRILNVEALLMVAGEICARKMNFNRASKFISECRNPNNRRRDLGGAIINAIRLHRKKYPATEDEIATRLAGLSWDFRDRAKREESHEKAFQGMIKCFVEEMGLEAPGHGDPGR